jgi:hypothetical protein
MEPVTDGLDPIRRLRVLAGALPGITMVEVVVDAPFDAVWAIAGDMLDGVPQYEERIAFVEITERRGERLRIITHPRRGPAISWNVLLRPGLCWMQSTGGGLLVGLAATPVPGGRTRLAHAEGSRARSGALVAPRMRRKLREELRIIERLARERATA